MKILMIILALAYIPLIFFVTQLLKAVARINMVLNHVEEGNFNERVRFSTPIKLIDLLGSNINRVIAKFQQTTERKQYLEDARKRMISNISHDLRTPLTSLLGYMDAVKNDIDLTEEEKKKYIDISYSKAMDLHKLMEGFFQLSKLEADDVALNIEKINIKNDIEEVLADFYEEFVREGIKPDIIFPDFEILVWGDRVCIKRIMTNLLTNAFRYGSDGGFIEIILRAKGAFAWIEVSNGGKGIPQKDLPHVFDRLYTSDKSRNSLTRGSGIGLAISKRLVESQKGEIVAASVQYKKTTFSFSLPIVKQ